MSAPSSEISQRLELAVDAARSAGHITLEYFRRDDLTVERKGDDSPVTIADRQAEDHLRRRIAEHYPDDAVMGEELSDTEGTTGFRWILDPIDGTKSFIHGVPLFGTLIGVEYEGKSTLGVIRIPALDECVYAAIGSGAWYTQGDDSPRPARVSSCQSLAEALFLTSEVKTFDEVDRRDAYRRLEAATRLTRTWGDCYGYLLLVTGRAEVMVDPVMAAWDAAALLPILQEAGGTFTDWQGNPTTHAGEGIGTNGHLLDEVLRVIRGNSPASKYC